MTAKMALAIARILGPAALGVATTATPMIALELNDPDLEQHHAPENTWVQPLSSVGGGSLNNNTSQYPTFTYNQT
jgi:hypothetical protein